MTYIMSKIKTKKNQNKKTKSKKVSIQSCNKFTGTENVLCKRNSDGKIFQLPRRFTRKKCKKFKKNEMGFTQRASCAPWF